MECWIYCLKEYPEEILKRPMLAEYADSLEQQYCERFSNIISKMIDKIAYSPTIVYFFFSTNDTCTIEDIHNA